MKDKCNSSCLGERLPAESQWADLQLKLPGTLLAMTDQRHQLMTLLYMADKLYTVKKPHGGMHLLLYACIAALQQCKRWGPLASYCSILSSSHVGRWKFLRADSHFLCGITGRGNLIEVNDMAARLQAGQQHNKTNREHLLCDELQRARRKLFIRL